MSLHQIVPGVYRLPLGIVNVYLINHDGYTLIDTGVPGSEDRILAAVRLLGGKPEDIRHILITHCHWDHSGSLQALKKVSGATAYMHPLDATLVRLGQAMRPAQPGPGWLNHLAVRLFQAMRPATSIPAAEIEHEVSGEAELPLAGGIRPIYTPGHTAGHLAYLWPDQGGVLFVGDAASNLFGLGYSLIYEDLQLGQRSLASLASLDFKVACFGHGRPIRQDAARHFRQMWGESQKPQAHML